MITCPIFSSSGAPQANPVIQSGSGASRSAAHGAATTAAHDSSRHLVAILATLNNSIPGPECKMLSAYAPLIAQFFQIAQAEMELLDRNTESTPIAQAAHGRAKFLRRFLRLRKAREHPKTVSISILENRNAQNG